jgi:DNA repair protein RadC
MQQTINKRIGPTGHRQRLRDRFLKAGRSALADYELLELLLTYAIPRMDTKPIAKTCLHNFGSILSTLQQPDERLLEIQGIGPNVATYLKAIHACLTRCMEAAVEDLPSISGPEEVFAFIRLHLGPSAIECIYALYLNEARRIVHHEQVGMGTVDRAALYPREILKPALIHNATGMILVHNHPEGEPVPSDQDLELTENLEDISAPLGIELLDHLIVTSLQAYSIKTGKLL